MINFWLHAEVCLLGSPLPCAPLLLARALDCLEASSPTARRGLPSTPTRRRSPASEASEKHLVELLRRQPCGRGDAGEEPLCFAAGRLIISDLAGFVPGAVHVALRTMSIDILSPGRGLEEVEVPSPAKKDRLQRSCGPFWDRPLCSLLEVLDWPMEECCDSG
mmetsp:Transcript_80320/g.250503  ORF Transcript_80320/g.250503 Transcript_80320/m.250503 type:complete len:163 (-) Transcript_80320:1296-1784(-)